MFSSYDGSCDRDSIIRNTILKKWIPTVSTKASEQVEDKSNRSIKLTNTKHVAGQYAVAATKQKLWVSYSRDTRRDLQVQSTEIFGSMPFFLVVSASYEVDKCNFFSNLPRQ